jgi:hypothetical protein
MKSVLYITILGLLAASTSCTQDKVLHNPRNNYKPVSMKGDKRDNNKAQFKKNRGTVGFGVDLNGNNPYKFRMVESPKRYKYSKAK